MAGVRKQAGFTLYAILGLLIVVGLMGIALKVQTERLDAKVQLLEACNTNYRLALKSIARQNDAVLNLKKEAEKRAKEAASALERARAYGKVKDGEIARLSAIKADPVVAGSCEKGVAAVRAGLK